MCLMQSVFIFDAVLWRSLVCDSDAGSRPAVTQRSFVFFDTDFFDVNSIGRINSNKLNQSEIRVWQIATKRANDQTGTARTGIDVLTDRSISNAMSTLRRLPSYVFIYMILRIQFQ